MMEKVRCRKVAAGNLQFYPGLPFPSLSTSYQVVTSTELLSATLKDFHARGWHLMHLPIDWLLYDAISGLVKL